MQIQTSAIFLWMTTTIWICKSSSLTLAPARGLFNLRKVRKTMKAYNYAPEAIVGVKKYIKNFKRNAPSFTEDAEYMEEVVASVNDSVHFLMPNNGLILNDDWKGLQNTDVRLPFPKITISYYVEDEVAMPSVEQIIEETGRPAGNPRKRLLIAEEVEYDDVANKYNGVRVYKGVTEKFIIISSIYYVHRAWSIESGQFIIPCTWDNIIRASALAESDQPRGMQGIPVHRMVNVDRYTILNGLSTKESLSDELVRNLSTEVSALMEFCEALTCSNVGFEKIKRKPNVRSLLGSRKKKQPSFETYTLTINVPSTRKVYDDADQPEGRTHKSPRQHLRRGHIRILADGRKIWVNSCVVGKIEDGKIEKDYEVKHDSL